MEQGNHGRRDRFRASTRELGGVPVVEAAGELSLESSQPFASALSEAVAAADGRIVVDLTAVSFIDSSGIAAIMNATREFRTGGGDVALAVAGGQVRRVLKITRLDELLAVYPNARAAAEDRNQSDMKRTP